MTYGHGPSIAAAALGLISYPLYVGTAAEVVGEPTRENNQNAPKAKRVILRVRDPSSRKLLHQENHSLND
jgi:hypothetical protein